MSQKELTKQTKEEETDSKPGKSDKGGSIGQAKEPVQVSKISLQGISKKIAAGKKIALVAEILPENAANKNISWSCSNVKYAQVDSQGVVTTKKAGAGKKVTITACALDGSGIKVNYKISIMKNVVKKITLKAAKKSVKAGRSVKVTATVKTNGKKANKALKWISGNTRYATVSSKGVVKTKKAGKGKIVTLTAYATDGSGKKAKIKIKIK